MCIYLSKCKTSHHIELHPSFKVTIMRALFLLSVAVLLSTFFPETALADKGKTPLSRCEKNNEKMLVTINTVQQGFRINNTYTSRRLNTRSRSSLAGDFVIGLTSLESKTIIDIDGPIWADQDTDGECFAAKIKIQLIYEPIDVFIGSEFHEGSCAYNAILHHEMGHVRLYQESLPKIEAIIQSLIRQRFTGSPIYAPKGMSRQLLESEIDTLWRPLIKSELAKVQIEQNELDKDDHIDKLTWECLGEFQSKFGFRFN